MSAATRLCSALLVALAVLAAFQPALGADFVNFDDPDVLVHNAAWRGPGALGWMWSASHMGHYHPLTWLSFALDLPLGGLDRASGALLPAAFHRTSVVLHALTAIAFLLAAARLYALGGGLSGRALAVAAVSAALLFALHPLRVESVAWVTERRDVLSGLFFVLAVHAWLGFAPRARAFGGPRRALAALGCSAAAVALFLVSLDFGGELLRVRGAAGAAGLAGAAALFCAALAAAAGVANADRAARGGLHAATAALLALSLAAKAWGIVLPALLLVLDAWPLARAPGLRSPRAWARWGLLLAEKAPFLALAAAGARLALWAQAHAGAALRPIGEHGWLERALQAAYGLCWYPWKTLAPAGLSPIYELPAELSLGEPRFALAAAGALALTALLVAARRRAPAALAAWVAFAVIASPVLGWAQSGPQLVADRYGYLACLPFALLAGWAAGRLFLARPALALGLAAGAALALGAAARDRSRDWRDSTALWEAAYRVAPESGVTLLSLGSAREEAAREEPSPERRRALLDEARSLFERGAALAAGPRFTANLGRVHEQLAELEPERAAEHRARAVELFERALAEAEVAGEDTADFELNLGAALVNAGRPGEALERLARCVARRPDEPRARLSYGMALALSGRVPESLEHFERAAALLPASAEAWGKLGDARRSAGDRAGAIAAYRRVLALEPGHAAAQRRLAELGAAAGE